MELSHLIDTEKEKWRTQLKALRQRLYHITPPDFRGTYQRNQFLITLNGVGIFPLTVAAYMAMGQEMDVMVDPLPQWLVPRMVEKSLHWGAYGNGSKGFEKHPWGIWEPSLGVAPITHYPKPIAVLVPALGVTPTGFRLGYGKGIYDHFLDEYDEDIISCVCTWEDLIIENLPIEAHDRPVDFISTEKGVFLTPQGLKKIPIGSSSKLLTR